jgi:L-rhamnose-H+ transport protein
VVGLILKEWKGTSVKTKRLLILALVVLLAAILLLTYGNWMES